VAGPGIELGEEGEGLGIDGEKSCGRFLSVDVANHLGSYGVVERRGGNVVSLL